jgi:myo-inositol catabolism protein IolS
MTYKELGNTGIKLSDVILGCWAMGNDYFSGQEDLDSTAAINAALENDINTFDTAYCYGRGHSEEVLGKALKGKREDCVVISKLWKTFMEKDAALKACDDSLKRLQTDYMDVYFIHYPSDTGVPIGETMEAMNKMKEQGKIRAIGLSNFSLAQMKEAMQYGQIDVIQPCYSLLWRFIDRDILPFCIENNIGVVTYSSLAQGMLTGAIKEDTVLEDGRSHAPLFLPQWRKGCLEITDALKPIGEKYGMTQAQVALNWVIRAKGITSALVGGRNAKEVVENAKAVNFTMTDEEFNMLNEMSKKFTDQLPNYKTFFDGTIVED